jgi:hypothetical protein
MAIDHMSDKKFFIKSYFEDWKQDLSKTKKLLNQNEYYLEAILILSCYIGALASLRYPDDKDGESYKKIVLKYSGDKSDIYKKIDVLFFYQWPRSDFKDHGSYKALKNYAEIKNILLSVFGDETTIKGKTRYVTQQVIMQHILSNPFNGLDKQNIEMCLPLFSVREILYRYVRCYAAHNKSFPLVNKLNGSMRFEDNHIITGKFLFQTVEAILNNLEGECLREVKWPSELGMYC